MIRRPKGSVQERCAPSAEPYQRRPSSPKKRKVTRMPIDSTRPGTIRLAIAV